MEGFISSFRHIKGSKVLGNNDTIATVCCTYYMRVCVCSVRDSLIGHAEPPCKLYSKPASQPASCTLPGLFYACHEVFGLHTFTLNLITFPWNSLKHCPKHQYRNVMGTSIVVPDYKLT